MLNYLNSGLAIAPFQMVPDDSLLSVIKETMKQFAQSSMEEWCASIRRVFFGKILQMWYLMLMVSSCVFYDAYAT